jgi:FkbM family methyltransferase
MTEQISRLTDQQKRNGGPAPWLAKPRPSMLAMSRAAARRGRGEGVVEIAPGRIARFVARHRSHAALRFAALVARVYLSAFENDDWDIRHNGEELLLTRATRLWQERFVALDIGSFAGEWTHLALQNNQHAEIHCFEIVGHLGEKLTATFADDPRVTVNRTGLWSHNGELSGYFSSKFPSMSSFVPAVQDVTGHPGKEFRSAVETGDAYCARRGIDHINFMKIDVEGAEFEVLRGFTHCFSREMVDIVQFEYGPLTLAAGHRLRDQADFLSGHGMLVGKLYPTHVQLIENYYPGLDDFRWSNYVAIRPEVATPLITGREGAR